MLADARAVQCGSNKPIFQCLAIVSWRRLGGGETPPFHGYAVPPFHGYAVPPFHGYAVPPFHGYAVLVGRKRYTTLPRNCAVP